MSLESPRPCCHRCRRPAVTCLCPHITPRVTRTRFVLLTHPMELRKEKHGTGRLVHLSLPNSVILDGVDFSRDPRVDALIADPAHDCRLVYPGPSARNLSRERYDPMPGTTPVLFLIDATWPCARKILKLSANVRALPRIGFDPRGVSEFHIKHQPDPVCLSTIETVHRVLGYLGASGVEAFDADDGRRLLQPFRTMIETQIAYAEDPTIPSYRSRRGYRRPSDRRPSLKHIRRPVL